VAVAVVEAVNGDAVVEGVELPEVVSGLVASLPSRARRRHSDLFHRQS
jgi:hypothetical protein